MVFNMCDNGCQSRLDIEAEVNIVVFLGYMPIYTWECDVRVERIRFLSGYRNLSFYTMRTDALDRFGTRLEQRFSRERIKAMMEQAGLERVEFSASEPFWCAVGYRCSIDKEAEQCAA